VPESPSADRVVHLRHDGSGSRIIGRAPFPGSSKCARARCRIGFQARRWNSSHFLSCFTSAAKLQPTPQWPLRERISWGAYLVLALVGYVGVMLALSTLKKIERNTVLSETTAQAALDASQAALATAQAILRSERPWILISVEPTINKLNSFTVTATNKGKTPATIATMIDEVGIKSDESHLPATPEYIEQQATQPMIPLTLVPGESTPIKVFSRDDVPVVCASEERFKRIENWDEKIFLHGKITYHDLVAPQGTNEHETNWCCWYIHGRQKSGMVIAGPPGYNSHT